MIRKLKDHSLIIGLVFMIALAILVTMLGASFFLKEDRHRFLFNAGMDSMGALACAALFFGCIGQSGEGTRTFRTLIIFVTFCFAFNEAISYTLQIPEQRKICFALCLIIKLTEIVMIWLFYKYVKTTLGFEGGLVKWAERVFPVLMAFEFVVLLSNIIYPVTFSLDDAGMYQATKAAFLEDIYLFTAFALTSVLIIRSSSRRSQKAAALTFILFPIVEYVISGGQFGNARVYGMILLSLIIMYCIIFNEKNRELLSTQADLDTAATIQTDALPPVEPEFDDHPEICLRGSMNTAKEVGGDFYDYFPIDDDRICFLIADVSGKGMPAALFMMTVKTMIKDYALTHDSTSEIFTIVNKRLCENNEEGMFATAWIGILDTRTMTLQYTNAGHNYPVFLRRGNPCELLEPVHGLFLAGLESTEYHQSEIQLAPGDRLLLYTDGVTEAHDRTNGLYGTERLEKVFESAEDAPASQVVESILDDIHAFTVGAPKFDDITMVILTVAG